MGKRPRAFDVSDDHSIDMQVLVSVAEVLDVLQGEGDVVDRIHNLRIFLDLHFIPPISREEPQPQMNDEDSTIRMKYYEAVLFQAELLEVLTVDVFWIIASSGFFKFSRYIEVIDSDVIVKYLRADTMELRMEEHPSTTTDMVSSIFVDIILYLYQEAYLLKNNDPFSVSSAEILDTVIGFKEKKVLSLDVYIFDFIVDIIQLVDDELNVRKFKYEYLKRHIDSLIECQLGIAGIGVDCLHRFNSVDMKTALSGVLLREESILLDDILGRNHGVSFQAGAVIVVDYLLRQKDSEDDAICFLRDVWISSVVEGSTRGILRCATLCELLYTETSNWKETYTKLLNNTFNESSSGGQEGHRLTTKGFSFLCLTLLESLSFQGENSVKALCRLISNHRVLHPEAADTYLKAGRARLSSLSRAMSLFSDGELMDRNALHRDVERLQSWVSAWRRTGQLPVGITQQCLVGGSQGFRAVLSSLRVLVGAHPEARDDVCDMAQQMSRGAQPLCPADSAQAFITAIQNEKGDDDSFSALLEGLPLSLLAREHLGRLASKCSRLCELMSNGQGLEPDHAASFLSEYEASVIIILRDCLDNRRVVVTLCLLILNICASFASMAKSPHLQHALYCEWQDLINRLIERIILGTSCLELCLVAVVHERLDELSDDDDYLVPISVMLIGCNEKILQSLTTTLLEMAETSIRSYRIQRLQIAVLGSLRLHQLRLGLTVSGRPLERLIRDRPALIICFLWLSNAVLSSPLGFKVSGDTMAYLSQLQACVEKGVGVKVLHAIVNVLSDPLLAFIRRLCVICPGSDAVMLWRIPLFLHRSNLVDGDEVLQETGADEKLLVRVYQAFRRHDFGDQDAYMQDVAHALLMNVPDTFLVAAAIRWAIEASLDLLRTTRALGQSKGLLIFLGVCSDCLYRMVDGRGGELTKHVTFLVAVRQDVFLDLTLQHLAFTIIGQHSSVLLLQTTRAPTVYIQVQAILEDILRGEAIIAVTDILLDPLTSTCVATALFFRSYKGADGSAETELTMWNNYLPHNIFDLRVFGWTLLSLLPKVDLPIQDVGLFIDHIMSALHESEPMFAQELQQAVVVCLVCSCLVGTIRASAIQDGNLYLAHAFKQSLILGKKLFKDEVLLLEAVCKEMVTQTSSYGAALCLSVLISALDVTTNQIPSSSLAYKILRDNSCVTFVRLFYSKFVIT